MHSLVSPPGHDANHVLLNVVRSKGPGRVRDAVLIDNLETNDESELAVACKQDDKYFRVGDFELGKCVTVINLKSHHKQPCSLCFACRLSRIPS